MKNEAQLLEAVAHARSLGHDIDPEAARILWDKAQITSRGQRASYFETDRSRELHANADVGMIEEAYKERMSLSAWLERQDPSPPDSPLDAYERQLVQCGIKPSSDYMHGISASTVEDLMQSGGRAEGIGTGWGKGAILFPELCRRAYMEGVVHGTERFNPERFYQSNRPLSWLLNPKAVDSTIRTTPSEGSFLNELVALTKGIPGQVFQTVWIDDQPTQQRLYRVAEGGTFPSVRLTVGEREHRTYKFGIALEITYEAVRQVALDELRFHIAQIGRQSATDQEQTAVMYLIDGDGNAGSAVTETDISAIGGTAGQIDAGPLIRFLALFKSTGVFAPRLAITDDAGVVDLFTTTYGTANAPMFVGPNAIFGGEATIRSRRVHPPVENRSYMVAEKILYVDTTAALGRAFEVGSALTETDRFIRRQMNEIVLSEVVGFWLLQYLARRVLDYGN